MLLIPKREERYGISIDVMAFKELFKINDGVTFSYFYLEILKIALVARMHIDCNMFTFCRWMLDMLSATVLLIRQMGSMSVYI